MFLKAGQVKLIAAREVTELVLIVTRGGQYNFCETDEYFGTTKIGADKNIKMHRCKI